MKHSNKFWYNSRTLEKKTKLTDTEKKDGFWDYWDSQAEFNFFQNCLLPVATELKLKIKRQHTIRISNPHTLISVKWKVDFIVFKELGHNIIPIEYKGNWIATNSMAKLSLKYQMQLLSYVDIALWQRYLIVSYDDLSKHIDHKKLSDNKSDLTTLKQHIERFL